LLEREYFYEKTSKKLLKEYVNSQHFTGRTDIKNGTKELFSRATAFTF